MLTVKHVEKSGYESICQASSVSFNFEDRLFIAQGVGSASVSGDDFNRYSGSGTIYVMNENGKTVGNYVL